MRPPAARQVHIESTIWFKDATLLSYHLVPVVQPLLFHLTSNTPPDQQATAE